MKIGILTFHASHNYGSMLQAYALQHYLNNCGHKVKIINLRTYVQKNEVYPHPLSRKLSVVAKMCLNPIWLYHACKRWQKFELFLRERLELTEKEYHDWNSIKEDLNFYDVIITGGDQIWNMSCKDFDQSYMLPGKLKVRKVSYCPSFGSFLNRITLHDAEYIKATLSDYDYISVREFSMKEYLKRKIAKPIEVTLDPTMLLTADDYLHIIDEKPLLKGDYMLYYTPQDKPEFEEVARLLSRHYGLKLITTMPHIRGDKGMKACYEVGPIEFLNLLKNAKMVVGRSFHLVVFSLIFHKDFIAINGQHDTRINNLLDYLNLTERGTITKNNYTKMKLMPIEYKEIDNMLAQLRLSSVEFLKSSLKK